MLWWYGSNYYVRLSDICGVLLFDVFISFSLPLKTRTQLKDRGQLRKKRLLRQQQGQQPCLQIDLSLIDVLSNRCIRHLKHDGNANHAESTRLSGENPTRPDQPQHVPSKCLYFSVESQRPYVGEVKMTACRFVLQIRVLSGPVVVLLPLRPPLTWLIKL